MDIFITWIIMGIFEVFFLIYVIEKDMKYRKKYIVLLVLFEMIVSIIIPIITNIIFMNNFKAIGSGFFIGMGAALITFLSISINLGICIVIHSFRIKTLMYRLFFFILLLAMSISLQVFLSYLAES